MERIKTHQLLHTLLIVLAMGMMWGCADDSVENIPNITEGEKGTVTISVKLPYKSNNSEPQTYASNGDNGAMLTEVLINGETVGASADAALDERGVTTRAGTPPEIIVPPTTINEIEVNEVVVLTFGSNGRVITTPIYVAYTEITNNSFTIDVREDTYEVVVLANINTTLANDLNVISAEQSKSFVLNRLQLSILNDIKLGTTNIPAWNATDMPMWGEKIINYSGVGTIIVNVELVRMMAKVDVTLSATAAINFKLESVRLYNYNSVGQVTPNLLLPNWATTPSVPTQPVVAIPPGVPVALVYTATDDRSCVNKVYTFEALKGSDNNLLTNTCLVIGGKYNDSGVEKDSYYRIDFANTSIEGASTYLDLLRNHHYKINVVAVTGPGQASPEDAFELPSIQPEANSYIVTPNGPGIMIPVSRSGIGANTAFTAQLVWTDNSKGVAPTSNIREVSQVGTGSSGYIVVKPGSASGNALVAIKSGNTILWSWHIWVTDYNPVPIGTGKFMDRNLGAIGNTPGEVGTMGLLYQWGRKDPFPGTQSFYNATGSPVNVSIDISALVGSRFARSFANPTTYYAYSIGGKDWIGPSISHKDDELWGRNTTAQTIYDPCPAGWRVPKSSLWSGIQTNSPWNAVNRGFTNKAYGGFYPAAGSRQFDSDGEIVDVGTKGYYWSASVDGRESRDLYFHKDGMSLGDNVRSNAYSVRCVKE